MLANIADLRLCALMSQRPYVLEPLGLSPYVLCPFTVSAHLCRVYVGLRPYVGFRPHSCKIELT